MSYKIILNSKAKREMGDSFDWYEKRVKGLGERFFSSVNNKLIEIAANPLRYSIKKHNYREVRTKTFPFNIVYEVYEDEQIVLILHVFHLKRNPIGKYKK